MGVRIVETYLLTAPPSASPPPPPLLTASSRSTTEAPTSAAAAARVGEADEGTAAWPKKTHFLGKAIFFSFAVGVTFPAVVRTLIVLLLMLPPPLLAPLLPPPPLVGDFLVGEGPLLDWRLITELFRKKKKKRFGL